MNVYEAIKKCDELKETIRALSLACRLVDTAKENKIIEQVKLKYEKELQDLEMRMKNTTVVPQSPLVRTGETDNGVRATYW